MRTVIVRVVTAIAVLDFFTGPWFAQPRGYTIQRPGELPTYATPNYGGGYTIQTPGHLPTHVNPW